MTRIEEFGWRGTPAPGIGRVVSRHGDYYNLVCNEAPGEIPARRKKSAFSRRTAVVEGCGAISRVRRTEAGGEVLTPMTGDFVEFRHNSAGDSFITGLLPRFSSFSRKDPSARRKAQTLAVNFDTLFIMTSLNEDFSPARVARYLDLASDMGEAEAVVVVSKIDLRRPGDEPKFAELDAAVAGRARVMHLSSITGEGLHDVMEYAMPRRTIALVGSSGVGKSTLVNALAGEEWMATQEIQEWSGRGRHTTTSRELVMLPCGAMVLDTPGVRELGRLGETDEILVKGESTHRYRK